VPVLALSPAAGRERLAQRWDMALDVCLAGESCWGRWDDACPCLRLRTRDGRSAGRPAPHGRCSPVGIPSWAHLARKPPHDGLGTELLQGRWALQETGRAANSKLCPWLDA